MKRLGDAYRNVPEGFRKIRIAADYRLTVNKVTPLEKYALSKVEEMFSKLQGDRVYSQI